MFFIFLSYLLEETCNKFHEEMNINERIQGRERERNKKESGRVVKIEFLCKRKVTYNTWHFAPSFHIIHPEKLATSPLKRIIHKNSTVWEVEKQGGWVGLDKTIHTHTHTHLHPKIKFLHRRKVSRNSTFLPSISHPFSRKLDNKYFFVKKTAC